MNLKSSIKLLIIALMTTSHQAWSNEISQDESKLPINIEADRLDAQDQVGISLYRGNVIATQGSLVLKGDQLKIEHPQRQVQQVTITGKPATFKRFNAEEQRWIKGQADTLIYYANQKQVELIGNALLEQEGGNKVQGPKLQYDLEQQTIQAGATTNKPGRVSVTITPEEDANQEGNR